MALSFWVICNTLLCFLWGIVVVEWGKITNFVNST